MVPEARPTQRLFFALVLLSSLSLPACGEPGGAFGLGKDKLAELLSGDDPAPILTLAEGTFTEGQLADTGVFGPEAYYCLADRIETLMDAGARRFSGADEAAAAAGAKRLYRRSYDQSSGLLKKESGLALLRLLESSGFWSELLDFSSACEGDLGPSWEIERAKLVAASALGLYPDAAAIAAGAAAAFPSEADAGELGYYAALAALRGPATRGSGKTWRKAFRRLVLEGPYSDWSARAFNLLKYEPRLSAAFSEGELHAAAMRDAVRRKEYGEALREARLASGAALSAKVSAAMLADAGKAYLYSGSSKEGDSLFAASETTSSRSPPGSADKSGQAWTIRYYRARFARALERWERAAELFLRAADAAPSSADADSCLWYAADSAYRGAAAKTGVPARAALLEALVAASSSWSDPGKFSDLADKLLGEALRDRDYGIILSMAERLGKKLDPETSARVAYLAARIFELGLDEKVAAPSDQNAQGDQGAPDGGARAPSGSIATQAGSPRGDRAAAAAVRFAAIADAQAAPAYYRALAAWRAGIGASFVERDGDGTLEAAEGRGEAPPGELEIFIATMADFGAVDSAFAEAKARSSQLDDSAMRLLAQKLSTQGRPDLAIRLALELSSRDGYRPLAIDYELLYPRPFLDLLRSACSRFGLSESLAFSLVRSESIFNADARSRAGATGLTQLMPATAASQARALGLESYDLKDPKDNLDLGLSHFASLVERTKGRPLRAMMAYNAGWGKYREATAGTDDLPDDLLVETLDIEETRLYCRKILAAAAMYGSLYYGKNADESVGDLVN